MTICSTNALRESKRKKTKGAAGIPTAPFKLSDNLIWSLLEIKVSLAVLDALDAAL